MKLGDLSDSCNFAVIVELKESPMTTNQTCGWVIPSWQDLEEIGAGDGVPTKCERCGKPGTPRQQFEHMGVKICYICADERVEELRSEGGWS